MYFKGINSNKNFNIDHKLIKICNIFQIFKLNFLIIIIILFKILKINNFKFNFDKIYKFYILKINKIILFIIKSLKY